MAEALEEEISNYEVEYTENGEVGLHKRRQKCKKNPTHSNFYPITTFSKQSLPALYRNDKVMDFITAIAELTVRIRVAYTSMSRPSTLPGSRRPFNSAEMRGCPRVRVGTGFITEVRIEKGGAPDTDDHCPCYYCKFSKTPETRWGHLIIVTAAHVLCTADELVHAEVDCFYNDDDPARINSVRTFYGSSVRTRESPITKVNFRDDFCEFELFSHDVELCLRLAKYSIQDLLTFDHGVSSDTNSCLTVIVSHPHGCPKCVSYGEWTSCIKFNSDDEPEKFRYHYNTPTCPGSSGALVWMLETSHDKWQRMYVHSAALTNGMNMSGAVEIFRDFMRNFCHIS